MENSLFKKVSIERFKDYFYRDFPFLPQYKGDETYWKDDIVYLNGKFYKSLKDNNTGHLVSDENYWQITKVDKYQYILDQDIAKAMTQALLSANERFGEDCEEKITIYLHLVAFYLILDLKNASVGINGAYQGVLSSKSVGDVSEGYSIPQWLLKSPMYSIYGQNGYGMKYLSLIAPYLAVTILYSNGGTTVG